MPTNAYLQTSRIYGLRVGFLSIESCINEWLESNGKTDPTDLIVKIKNICSKTLRSDDLYHASLTRPKTEK